jgi:hypothetical protein
LVIAMLGNVLGVTLKVFLAAAAGGAGRAAAGTDPASAAGARSLHNTLLFLALLDACAIACLTGVWMWKRWGVYGYVAIACLGFFVGFRASPFSSGVNGAGSILVAGIVAMRWREFE